MNFQDLLNSIKEPKYAMIVGCVVTIVVLTLIIRNLKKKRVKKQLEELDIRFNELRSEPLSYKLQKTMALAKANAEVAQLVPKCKEEFDKVQEALVEISSLLTEADDLMFMHKTRKAIEKIDEADEMMEEIGNVVEVLSSYMDQVLEKESIQRADITKLKEQYRNLRSHYTNHGSELQFVSEFIENECVEIEELFTKFEEYIFASEFDTSKDITATIAERIKHLDEVINEAPKLSELANVTVKSMVDEVCNLYLQAREVGVVVNHLEVNKNLDLINEIINQDLNKLKAGLNGECEQSLQECMIRLNQLTQQIEREAKSYEQFTTILSEIRVKTDEELDNMSKFKASYEKNRERFGYENWDTFISNNIAQLTALSGRIDELGKKSQEKETPYTNLLITVKEYEESLKHMSKEIATLSDKLNAACRDENRAIEQVEKLYLTLHDVQVKLRKYRLPSIGSNFEQDLRNGYTELHEVEHYLNQVPLNIESLNGALNIAIDHIYKLHNRVNQLVGSANMVENAIVYANKYRSSYPDVDSELTRAELCFKNGEYTQALTISIQMIEKIHPGSYESLIRSQELKG